jgi:hypothetical protein
VKAATVGIRTPANYSISFKDRQQRYRVVKITCSYFEVVLRTMMNYEAHYSLSWFMPLIRGNSPTSSIFYIEEE